MDGKRFNTDSNHPLPRGPEISFALQMVMEAQIQVWEGVLVYDSEACLGEGGGNSSEPHSIKWVDCFTVSLTKDKGT